MRFEMNLDLDASGICSIIESCKGSSVDFIKVGPLEIRFGHYNPDEKRDPVIPEELHTSNPELQSRTSNGTEQEQTNEVEPDESNEKLVSYLEDLALHDPVAYESLVTSDEGVL